MILGAVVGIVVGTVIDILISLYKKNKTKKS